MDNLYISNTPDIYTGIRLTISKYVSDHKLKALVLGLSGGFDSTYLSFVCRSVCRDLNIKFIGVSLPTSTNGSTERDQVKRIMDLDRTPNETFIEEEEFGTHVDYMSMALRKGERSSIAMGNLKARMRMMYLYDIAHSERGIIIGTSNKSEHLLGFWTICGDVGDLDPMEPYYKSDLYDMVGKNLHKFEAEFPGAESILQTAIEMTATDGNGCGTDLSQIGCKSYRVVDSILKRNVSKEKSDSDAFYTIEEYKAVMDRYYKSKFKRTPNHIKLSSGVINGYAERFMVFDTASLKHRYITGVVDKNKLLLVKYGNCSFLHGKWGLPQCESSLLKEGQTITDAINSSLFELTGVKTGHADVNSTRTEFENQICNFIANISYDLSDSSNLTNFYSPLNVVADIKVVDRQDLAKYDIYEPHMKYINEFFSNKCVDNLEDMDVTCLTNIKSDGSYPKKK